MPRLAPDPLDRIIGANIKRLRLARGTTQETLGASLSVTQQQFRKYESGINSISAAKLAILADALECSIIAFFEVR